MLVKQRSWVILAVQVLLVFVCLVLAWLLRFDFSLPQRKVLIGAVPLLLLMRMAAISRCELLHGYWRYTGISDAQDIMKAVVLGSIGFAVAERGILGIRAFPISIYFLEAMLTAGALAGVRLFSRVLLESIEAHQRPQSRKIVVIVGAGDAGQKLLRELPRSGYVALGLVDDDPAKSGVRLHGVPVLGGIDKLPEIIAAHTIDELLIAIPSATGAQMRRILELCRAAKVRFRTIPGLRELIDGAIRFEQLRDVNLEDLLGREPVQFNLDSVRRVLADRVVMVTGAAGSIGSELCRQIADYGPAELICVDQAETPLFHLQQALQRSQTAVSYYVADITDTARMRRLIAERGVRAILHAAAYKHVPLMESNLQEALKNNVFGLLHLLHAAEQCGCEDFLLISSDKAVNPTSFMGCTKRIGELLMAAHPVQGMRCLSVRFGNVLGSQGSVVPLFQEQIRSRHEITVTHPEITRYFMSIPEAVSLVLQAFSIGKHRDLLVLDMGQPIRILDLAKTLITLSGLQEHDVKIVYTGLRPGEKLFEELFYEGEQQSATAVSKIRHTRTPCLAWPKLLAFLNSLETITDTGDARQIRTKVQEAIPEYSWERAEPEAAAETLVPQRTLAPQSRAALSGAMD